MGTTSNDWRAGLVGWSLRGAGAALGLWFVALLTATVASAQTADLAVTQSSTPNPAMAGDVVNVTITVTNNGPSAASDVAMVDLFPPDSFVVIPGADPAGWTCTPGVNLVECTIPTLAAGGSAIFQPAFRLSAEPPSGAVLVNDAIITSTTVDPNPANNLASVQTTISTGGTPASPADLAVAKTGPAAVQPGQNIAYTITLTNNGPNAASSPLMNDATPPDTIFVSLASPAGWNCGSPAVGMVGRVECVLPGPPGSLASGATVTFTLTVQAQVGTPSGLTTTNVVKAAQSIANGDPILTNNRASVDTLIALPTATPTATATATVTSTATATSTATPTPIPGDYNRDGFVDIRDYGVWRQNFGQTNCGNPADGDGNCLVDIRDYGIWRLHFGEGTPPDRRGSPPRAGVDPAPQGTPGPALLGSDQPATGSSAPNEPNGSGPAVSIVPLVGGLLGLGGLAGWRRRRPGGQ